MPVTQFAAVTPFGALVWIGGIFIITKLLGSQALIGFSFLQGKIAAIVFTAFFLTATLFLLKRLVTDGRDGSPSRPLGASHGAARPAVAPYHAVSKAGTCSRSQKWRSPVLIRRWMHWEFWPAWLFYIPVGVYYAWLAIRHRGLSVPTSANPGIATDGFIGESKLEMLDQLRRRSQQFTAEAFLSRDLQSPTGCFVCTGSAVSMKLRCLSF